LRLSNFYSLKETFMHRARRLTAALSGLLSIASAAQGQVYEMPGIRKITIENPMPGIFPVSGTASGTALLSDAGTAAAGDELWDDRFFFSGPGVDAVVYSAA
jgi:hypothetical protein